MKKYIEDKNYYYDIIRKNIKKYRLEKKFSQEMLAAKINYSLYYIKSIESLTMKKSFSIIVLGRIADVLKIDIKEFFNS